MNDDTDDDPIDESIVDCKLCNGTGDIDGEKCPVCIEGKITIYFYKTAGK